MDKRNTVVADLGEGLKLYGEIAKAWLIKSIKHPLISLIKEPLLNLNFLAIPENSRVSAEELQNRLMKAKVRLKGILKGILDQSTAENIPMPLVSFLVSIVTPGQFLPDGLLSQYELETLSMDSYGSLVRVSER